MAQSSRGLFFLPFEQLLPIVVAQISRSSVLQIQSHSAYCHTPFECDRFHEICDR